MNATPPEDGTITITEAPVTETVETLPNLAWYLPQNSGTPDEAEQYQLIDRYSCTARVHRRRHLAKVDDLTLNDQMQLMTAAGGFGDQPPGLPDPSTANKEA